MGVLGRKRTKSKLQVFINAIELRKDMTILLLRDFCIRPKVRKVEDIAKNYKMSEEDAEMYLELVDKYHIDTVLNDFPFWFVDKIRDSILNCLRDMAMHITIANTIYPETIYECDVRRQHQNLAISCCEFLLQELQYIKHIIPMNLEKIDRYVDMVVKETALLKAWRKSDNKIRGRVIAKELKKYRSTPFVPYMFYDVNNMNLIQQPVQTDPRLGMDALDEHIKNKKVNMCKIVDKNGKPEGHRVGNAIVYDKV